MDGPPRTQNPPEVTASEGLKEQSGGDHDRPQNTTKRREDYARDRYTLHGHIRRHLIDAAAKSHPGKHPGNVYRTAACTWVPIGAVGLMRPADRDSYHYKGLATCGSTWTCPLCAAKIQERRRQEVVEAIDHKRTQGMGAVMVSMTFPHRVDQPLADLLRLQREALAYLRGWRRYIALMGKIANAGRIRSLEVTHGLNGWHPHTHELLFVDPKMPAEFLREELAPLWLHACRKVGLFVEGRDNEGDFLRYSVDVQTADRAVSAYLAKIDQASGWNVSHELTKSSSKQGRRSGQHPFRLAMSKETAWLFLHYVDAIKGQQQLVWSRGLKAEVGIEDKSDAVIVEEESAKAADQIDVTRSAWRVVLGNDARWELTDAAKAGGADGVREMLVLLGWEPDQ